MKVLVSIAIVLAVGCGFSQAEAIFRLFTWVPFVLCILGLLLIVFGMLIWLPNSITLEERPGSDGQFASSIDRPPYRSSHLVRVEPNVAKSNQGLFLMVGGITVCLCVAVRVFLT